MKGKNILLLLFCLYAVLLAISIWNHEMWRDELQTWGIVIHSAGFSDLLENKKYEGHPILWFAIVWVVSKFTGALICIQVINYLFALITAWLIIYKSPFRVLQKTSLVFSYYFFYEYAAISRNYMLAIMLIIGICVLWKSSARRPGLIMLLLFLLCFTEAYASIISVCLAITLLVQQYFRSLPVKRKLVLLFFPLAAITGSVLSYITTVPPDDSEVNYPVRLVFSMDHLLRVLGNFWNGMIPVPKFTEHFWSMPLLNETTLAAILGIILMGVILTQAFSYKSLFIFLLLSISGIMLFMYFKYSGYQRHFGHFFILYICYEWIKRYELPVTNISVFQKGSSVILYAILILNTTVGISFAVADWILPFSSGKQTARYISTHFPKDVSIAGFTDCPVTTVANYLEKDIYLLNNLHRSSYITFSTRRIKPTYEVVLFNTLKLADSLHSMVLIMNYPFDFYSEYPVLKVGEKKTLTYQSPTGDHQIHFKNLAYFGNSMVDEENFYVYEVNRSMP
ncbi:MAG: hypothetical protein ABIO46_07390 [Chitinophagales bacterium]